MTRHKPEAMRPPSIRPFRGSSLRAWNTDCPISPAVITNSSAPIAAKIIPTIVISDHLD